MAEYRAIHIEPQDTVATALGSIPAGAKVAISDKEGRTSTIAVAEAIPPYHKLALREIEAGEEVVKYGHPIGRASRKIEPGEWVHIHNLRSRRGKGREHA
jgi:altronate dehydratase